MDFKEHRLVFKSDGGDGAVEGHAEPQQDDVQALRQKVREVNEELRGVREELKAAREEISRLRGAERREASVVELSPEQIWLGEFQTRFDALPQLHEGIEWSDVEKSLLANPEAMRKLQVLDIKGHKMNVFGEEGDELIFVSAWENYGEVSEDHRNIVFDAEAQNWLVLNYPDEEFNGNAIDIAKAIGVDLADLKFHEQLKEAIAVNSWAWLKTDADIREAGVAFFGGKFGVGKVRARDHSDLGSFRAALRVKKA